MMRRNLRKILTEAGFEVVAEAANGAAACEEYGKHHPDLVTMDINMPVMDGIESVKRILVDFPEARIVMISAHNEQSLVYQAIKLGAKNYIVKPVSSEKVLAVVSKVLGDPKNEAVS
jgi:two-component system chemotaxis response regulator CheY